MAELMSVDDRQKPHCKTGEATDFKVAVFIKVTEEQMLALLAIISPIMFSGCVIDNFTYGDPTIEPHLFIKMLSGEYLVEMASWIREQAAEAEKILGLEVPKDIVLL